MQFFPLLFFLTSHFNINPPYSYSSAKTDKCFKTSPVYIMTLSDKLQAASMQFSDSSFPSTWQFFSSLERFEQIFIISGCLKPDKEFFMALCKQGAFLKGRQCTGKMYPVLVYKKHQSQQKTIARELGKSWLSRRRWILDTEDLEEMVAKELRL